MKLEGFVNIHGEPIAFIPDAEKKKRPAKDDREGYHNGWRVQGIPPGALEEARKLYLCHAADERAKGKEPKSWDEANWLMNAKRKPVRSKPCELESAARDCRALAEKSGWLRVEIVELKKEATP